MRETLAYIDRADEAKLAVSYLKCAKTNKRTWQKPTKPERK